jgi:hypothetical protein
MDGITRDWLDEQLRRPAPPRPPEILAGLDLGKVSDYSALAVIERTEAQENGRRVGRYAVRGLRRWQLHTDYTKIAADLSEMYDRPPLCGTALAVDATGVGNAVVEIVRAARPRCKIVPVVITGSQQSLAQYDPRRGWTVPKKVLADTLQALLGTRRLKASPDLPDYKVLTRELQAFTVKVNIATGNESFEAWREKDHDDMVLAVAIACWFGEQGRKRPVIG